MQPCCGEQSLIYIDEAQALGWRIVESPLSPRALALLLDAQLLLLDARVEDARAHLLAEDAAHAHAGSGGGERDGSGEMRAREGSS